MKMTINISLQVVVEKSRTISFALLAMGQNLGFPAHTNALL